MSIISLETLTETDISDQSFSGLSSLNVSDDEGSSASSYGSEVHITHTHSHVGVRSVYYNYEKYFIVFLAGMAGFWSTISSPIYLPVLPILQKQFNVSTEQVNVTMVVYSIFQGLAPVLFSNLADQFGRRILILSCLLIYMGANVGLALNNSFGVLIFFRCLQAFGISSTVSISSGIASDITTRAERGSFIGISTGLSLLGQAFGAFIGGLIENSLGWRAIFWFLVISSGITFFVIFIFLPETSRFIVGNGSSLPMERKFVLVAPILLLPCLSKRRTTENKSIEEKKPFTFLCPFRILVKKAVYLTLLPSSISYATWLMMLTTLSTSLSSTYGYKTLDIGLSYIPSGLGGLLGSVTSGKLLDLSYKREYKKYTYTKDHASTEHPAKRFNIFKARLSVCIFPTILSVVGVLLFSWSIQYHRNVAIPLVGSFLVSYAAMNFMTISTTLLVDLFPAQSSASSSCVNITRCWCAAILIAALSKMVDSMGIGGCYTLMSGLLMVTSLTIPYILYKSDTWLEDEL
ncbi:MFS antiporter Qdrp1 [[Candida] anglica]|uniref:MFS antiporter Qdrp1 n=1 Tax=[Candida] anglica TaxID=148631 RepID=A0ABP0EC42_9ASCO